jgi:hypothetical protein
MKCNTCKNGIITKTKDGKMFQAQCLITNVGLMIVDETNIKKPAMPDIKECTQYKK